MTYDMYHFVFTAAGIICLVMLAVTILLFLILKVPELIGYFTGITEQKAVEKINKKNKRFEGGQSGYDIAVFKKGTEKSCSSGYMPKETEVLADTGVATGQVVPDETSLLPQGEKLFQVEYEICYIHSSEIIG